MLRNLRSFSDLLRLVQGEIAGPGASESDTPEPAASNDASDAEALVASFPRETARGAAWERVDPKEYPGGRAILAAEPTMQVELALVICDHLMRGGKTSNRHIIGLKALLSLLVRRRLPYSDEDVCRLLQPLSRTRPYWELPYQGILRSVQRHVAERGLSAEVRAALERAHEALRSAGSAESEKAVALIDELLGVQPPDEALIEPGDDWGAAAAAALDRLPAADRAAWHALLARAKTADGSKPSARWLKAARAHVEALGQERFVELASEWLGFLGLPSRDTTYQGPAGWESPSALVDDGNADLLKGLAWTCSPFDDPTLARAVGAAGLACFKKLAGIGARSPRAGNACVWALGAMPGLHGVAQLGRLRQRVKYPSAQKRIESAFDAAARRAGLSRDDLEELTVPGHGLEDGRLRIELGDYAAELVVDGPSSVELRWTAADGTPRQTEPAEVKRACPAELKDLKRTADEVRASLAAQRDRVERLLLAERDWSLADWRERYLDHPLLSAVARRLIWRFEGDRRTAAGGWLAGRLVDVDDRPLDWPTDATRVRLWHPLGLDPADVLAWRSWLERHSVTQPFKQAHREIYLITDPERQTATYSNRFAAHILRQHQLQALCQQRGWRYRLQGSFDGDNAPTLDLPRWGLRAELWLDYLDNAPESAHGIALYIGTDQVRFSRPAPERGPLDFAAAPLPLAAVPPLVFSEVMRDVDLFVGVCSLGNDPNWQPGGRLGFDDYWHSYSFGDLSAAATTRRQVLDRLLPRLKIAPRCTLADRFLVVRGDLRTYKIHLGSANILMEPNDQYLCIVPGRGSDPHASGRTFLPFDGDATLSIILSKAFLLADDTTIKDPSITRQIKRG